MESRDRSRGRGNDLYERYVKLLEPEHAGEYVAVSHTGETVLGIDLLEVALRAKDLFGPGIHLFKVGERAVGKWR